MIQNLEQYYKVLGLEPGASLDEINQAYKDLAFIWHPDRLPQEQGNDPQRPAGRLQDLPDEEVRRHVQARGDPL